MWIRNKTTVIEKEENIYYLQVALSTLQTWEDQLEKTLQLIKEFDKSITKISTFLSMRNNGSKVIGGNLVHNCSMS